MAVERVAERAAARAAGVRAAAARVAAVMVAVVPLWSKTAARCCRPSAAVLDGQDRFGVAVRVQPWRERRDIESPLGALAAARVAFKLNFKLIRLRLTQRRVLHDSTHTASVPRGAVERRDGDPVVWGFVLLSCVVVSECDCATDT